MYEMQLQWMRNLQNALRTPWLDGFFKSWDYVDTPYFVILIISLAWYLWDRRVGMRVFYIFVISLAMNEFLKGFFAQPRPCHVNPSIGILCHKTFGFPSGAAQTAAIVFGVVFVECKRRLYRWLALVFACLLCFSRIYLGVHFPTDILGGLFVGGVLVLVYWKIFPLFEKWWKVAGLSFSFVLLLLGYLPLFFQTLGVLAGLITYEKIDVQKVRSYLKRTLQLLSVLLGLCILYAASYTFPSAWFLWDFSRGYWLSFLGGWVIYENQQN